VAAEAAEQVMLQGRFVAVAEVAVEVLMLRSSMLLLTSVRRRQSR